MEKEISIKVNARHVGQLGRELVTDYVTALTELVKNSYDADGEGVEVAFTNMLSGEGKIIIADTGCGFSSDDIETKWAVIGTSSKVKNPYSKKYKRRCVGRKGIGRYSVERLAEYCTLYSFTKDNRPVKYYMNWNKYEGIDFNELKQRVEILENSPDFESAKYIKRAVEYLLVSERIDIDSKNIIREKILKNNKLDFSIFYSKETLGNIQQFLYPIYEKYNGIEERVEDIKNVVEELEGEEKELYHNKLRTLYKHNSREQGWLIINIMKATCFKSETTVSNDFPPLFVTVFCGIFYPFISIPVSFGTYRSLSYKLHAKALFCLLLLWY